MADILLSDDYKYTFCESVVEYLLRGGASLDACARVIILINKELKIININNNSDTTLEDKISEYILEVRESMLMHPEENEKRKIQDEIYNMILGIGEGTFTLSECYTHLNLKTAEEKTSCRMALNRLVTREIIQRDSTGKSGRYRILDNKTKKIDIANADTKPIIVKYPLGIHEYVNTYKGNVVIIGGESNAGKTALCLNIAKLNREYWHVNYLSSEMQDGTELRIRLEAFNEPLSIWDSVEFVYRTDNYPDVMDPDGLNIIDYLDEGKGGEAYQVPRRIREISEKLKTGIAVICLQKHSQKSFAYGGEGTLNAARLYLSITRQGILRIEKAKMWRNHNINPNGMYCNFKLAAGCKFMIEGVWRKD